ncbi:M16 family metallopeptidase [Thermonema rossianum]|uniref:M16 family metallopeptidase n=1 Tax=Thermonema rossianum TaxID=55505 RepID=UPI000570DD0B|nr:M16 family metallopeptidase [Thermonema rossianum]
MLLRRTLLTVWLVFWGGVIWAQSVSNRAIPLDPHVKTGVLPNGLTYYIRHNQKPEKRVELRLVVNAGSVLEDEKQLGLAHFVEHMAFNGTKKFPKNEIVSYLQSIGVQFGGDLNAYTSFDETVYMLPVPTDKPELVDKGLEILREWASNVTFEPEEVEKERGVVLEEWRLGRGAEQRMMDKQFPVILKGSRYAKRLPIGTEQSLKTFKYKDLVRFYKDWYRPDLMAVVVVGDIDPAQIEQKIKALFGDLKAPKKAPKREFYPVPDHKEMLVTVASDKEAAFPSVQLLFKKAPVSIKTEQDYLERLKMEMVEGMLSERLEELRLSAEPPFSYAWANYGNFVRTKDAFSLDAITDGSKLQDALQTLLTEARRAALYGFVEQEFELYKKKYLAELELQYNDRQKTESKRLVWAYVNHYLEGAPAPGIEYKYAFAKEHLDKITLEDLNALIKQMITGENMVVVVQGPEKEGVKMPTEEEVRRMVQETQKQEVKPYEAKALAASLMQGIELKPGKVTAEHTIESLGVIEWTLSNGARVLLKPTNFKDDEVLISAFSYGGSWLADEKNLPSAEFIAGVVAESGVYQFSATELSKMLAGKNVEVSPTIGNLLEGFRGKTTPKDLQTALELLHLYFVAPRHDPEAFRSALQRSKGFMTNLMANPMYYFYDQYARLLSNYHPYGDAWLPDYDKIDYDKGFAFYKERFADASDFTFLFVGNIDPETFKPMVERYIASLPSLNRKEKWIDRGVRPPKGKVDTIFYKGSDPKSMVQMVFAGELPAYDEKEAFLLQMLGDLLNIKLVETIREEASGVYTVGAYGYMTKSPSAGYRFGISFPCAPERVEELTALALAEVKKVQEGKIAEEDLQKIKEQYRRKKEVELQTNNYWLNALQSRYFEQMDPEGILKWEEKLQSVTKQNLQTVAKKYLDTNAFIRAVLKPEQKP